ncbi:leucine-rich repeat-containing protein 15-like isoform X2 [Homalodisca vitripennis]|uniref:leucine-rich repeat-containing protein 15-like isoform X2 n=1 Tax=Homalodisca vitripennis TaxID=197043 RepID=UPI001EEC2948|nr:leucine-rich repeat-containing protein 15-like isoform X2 [Homalodisca vitripennis]
MGLFAFIAILLAVIYGGFSVDIQCPEEGCGNLTIYLGPNRDSKIVILTRSEGNPEHSNEHPSRPLPTNTPVPTTSKIPRIFKLNQSFFKTTSRYFRSYTTTSKPLFRNSTFRSTISQSDQRLLDLSYKDITGEDLAGLLSRLTETAQANIRYLYLSHNRISDLPVFTFIRARLQLTVLRIDNNHLGQSYTTFSEIFNLHTLRELNMSRCGLTSLECLYNPSLEVLDLSYNRLQSIPTYLDRLPNLNRLILDGNQIQFLHYFPHSSNLQHLYLSNNNLSYISNNTFQSFRGWFQLRVNNNSLEDASLIHVNRFFVLYLGGNPWQCSCSLLDMMSSAVDSDSVTN